MENLENLIECPRCLASLPKESFFIREGETKPYWEGCKTCYKVYRRELREKKRANPSLDLDLKGLEATITKLKNTPNGIDREAPERLEKELSFLNAKYLGRGLDRMVFALGSKLVLKVDSGSHYQTKAEIKQYQILKKLPKAIQDCFLPILACDTKGFNWVIMPRAITRDDEGREKMRDIEEKLSYKLERNHLNVDDLHNGNVGIYKGKPVIIDYGFPIALKGVELLNE
jgi:hypothetical protein